MNQTILITGGSGFIGTALTRLLLGKGYSVRHLGRKGSRALPGVETFLWDVDAGTIDEDCIEGVDTIVHLAGENIAGKRWTKKRKDRIIRSRTDSIRLIYGLLAKNTHRVKALISASGINYYGDRGGAILTEEDKPANTFLASVCVQWEAAADEAKNYGLRVVKLRTGMVLDRNGGALPQLARPVKYYAGSVLGSGDQWISWIHLDDAAGIYLFAVENEIEGAFNMSAPGPATNRELTHAVAGALNRPLWLPKVPAFALKLVLGEMSSLLLESIKASAKKIQSAGYRFQHPALKEALQTILR